MNRRAFLKQSMLLSALSGLALGTYGSSITNNDLQKDELEVLIKELPPLFQDYRIAFLSDIHLGSWVSNDLVAQSVSLINASKPDLILLGGDYLWIHDHWLEVAYPDVPNKSFSSFSKAEKPYQILSLLSKILSGLNCPDGIYASLGNHDHWVAPQLCLDALKQAGIRPLINDDFAVQRGNQSLRIFGIDDYWTGAPKFPEDGAANKRTEGRIVMTHNPDLFGLMFDTSQFEFDLGFAGHTHGGQIKLPVIGAPIYNIEDLRFKEGLYQHPKAPIYTSRGVGVVELPFRVNCPPEVSIITLKQA